jgi:hypothetical protein
MGLCLTARSGAALLVLGLGIASAGCSYAPADELKLFRESVVAANSAATPVLDELSATEKRQEQTIVTNQERRSRTILPFDPRQARYFSDISDGPAASVFRRGHQMLDRLSDVLLALATGSSSAGEVAAVGDLVTEAAGLLNVIGVGIAAGPAFETLKPALTELSRDLSRTEARRVIAQVEASHLVKNLVDALISATPKMFVTLTGEAERRANSAGAPPDAMSQLLNRSAKVRVVLSNYVVLLRQTNDAWNEAVQAAQAKSSSANFGALTERVAEVKAAALATRRAFADLNASR